MDEQQWLFVPAHSGFFIKNRTLIDSSPELCLLAGGSPLKIASCTGTGGTDYTSKRLWNRDAGNPSVLTNKYMKDLGRPNYLQATENNELEFGSVDASSSKWSIAKHYGTIRNFEQGPEQCLTLADNNINIQFTPCTNEPDQDWRLSEITPGYQKITSRALTVDSDKCLGSDLTMIDCQGSGYVSQRSWTYKKVFNPSGVAGAFINKYRTDLGRDEVLGSSDGRLQMLPRLQARGEKWQVELQALAVAKRPMLGNKPVLLLHTQYSNWPPTDFEKVKGGFIGNAEETRSFAAAMLTASHNRLRFMVDSVTGLDLGPRPEDCPSTALRLKAMELARNKGYDTGKYAYIAVEIPSTSCSWVGLAARPGSWAMANDNGWKPWLWQHEFGHSLGGPHAKSLEHCQSHQGIVEVGGEGCTVTNAGDVSDSLNGGAGKLTPIPYQYFAGWLTDEEVPEVVANGEYRISPLFGDNKPGASKGLRIFRSDGTYLMVEFRQPHLPFEDWSPTDPFVNGVIVRIANFAPGYVSSTLVDTTPDSAKGMQDAPLMKGKSLNDLLSGKKITVREVASTGATILVSDIDISGTVPAPAPTPAAATQGEEVED